MITLLDNIFESYKTINATKFSFQAFSSIKGNTPNETIAQLQEYASARLKHLGRGGARRAYLLSTRKVLKIAINEKGIQQNNAEIEISKNAKPDAMITKVYDYSKSDSCWLICELIRPVNNEEEFFKYAQYDLSDVIAALKEFKKFQNSGGKVTKSYVDDLFLWNAWQTVNDANIAIFDLNKIDHWGINVDNELVILDYGFTNQMLKKVQDDTGEFKDFL